PDDLVTEPREDRLEQVQDLRLIIHDQQVSDGTRGRAGGGGSRCGLADRRGELKVEPCPALGRVLGDDFAAEPLPGAANRRQSQACVTTTLGGDEWFEQILDPSGKPRSVIAYDEVDLRSGQ